jgi:hypothetical protein
MDVVSSKKGVKKSIFTEASTENGKKKLNSAVKVLGDRLKCLQIHLVMLEMRCYEGYFHRNGICRWVCRKPCVLREHFQCLKY